jgi:hypothetical protein
MVTSHFHPGFNINMAKVESAEAAIARIRIQQSRMSTPHDRRSLLRPEGSDLSEASTAIASPGATSPAQQHGYRRMLSDSVDLTDRIHEEGDIVSQGRVDRSVGLGISGTPRPLSTIIQRVPVGAKESPQIPNPPNLLLSDTSYQSPNPAQYLGPSPQIQTPGSSNPLLSPAWQQQSKDNTFGYDGGGNVPIYDQPTGGPQQAPYDHSRSPSYGIDNHQPYIADDDITGLKRAGTSMLENGLLMPGCTTKRDIHTTRRSWLSTTILLLSIYSTVMSGLWLMTAFVQPRWGKTISSTGRLTPSTASLLSALFAKTIELSFVTVFVGFLGQVLSRRSLIKNSHGVSIAEMSMRTWIIQPGMYY